MSRRSVVRGKRRLGLVCVIGGLILAVVQVLAWRDAAGRLGFR